MPAADEREVALTERDHEVLLSLLKYRYLSTSQLERLHFPSAQTAARRIRLLATGGFVSAFRPLASQDRLVALAKRGAEVVAERLEVPLDQLGWDGRREKPKDYLFLQHFLAASDFRISLSKSCDGSDVRLLGFLPEHLVEPAPKGSVQKYIREAIADATDHRAKISHTPDAVFALERAGTPALFFLEIDRGTEVLSNPSRGVLKSVRFYLSLLVSDAYQRYQADFGVTSPFRAFRVLIVTTSADRLSNMRSTCGKIPFEPARAKRFIWLTTEDAVLDSAMLSRPWVSLDPTDNVSYAIAPIARPTDAP